MLLNIVYLKNNTSDMKYETWNYQCVQLSLQKPKKIQGFTHDASTGFGSPRY